MLQSGFIQSVFSEWGFLNALTWHDALLSCVTVTSYFGFPIFFIDMFMFTHHVECLGKYFVSLYNITQKIINWKDLLSLFQVMWGNFHYLGPLGFSQMRNVVLETMTPLFWGNLFFSLCPNINKLQNGKIS